MQQNFGHMVGVALGADADQYSRGMTFVFSTHDRMIMERSRRLVTLADGRIDSDEVRG